MTVDSRFGDRIDVNFGFFGNQTYTRSGVWPEVFPDEDGEPVA
jgi:hypothetical protein